jgi:2,4-dienoyl-CoA reductase-like NADH-dependent reductase (Old Yellow Enzyme family)/thioredoxin reductase
MKENLFPHVFQPLTIRGLTLKNRLQYAPTVVLKCAPNGDMTQEMLDFMEWQARTGVAYVTVGDTPVTHDTTSAWLCEMNVNSDDCIHGMNQLVEAARKNGAELSVELAHAGRGSRVSPQDPPAFAVSASRPVDPEITNLKEMDRADMDYMKSRYVDCAVRCKKAGFRMIMLHCAHNNFLAQWLSTDSNVRTDDYGGNPENRRRFPLEVLKAVRESVGTDMVIEIRVSATEDTEGGLGLAESLDFMELAQDYVDIIHVSRGNIFTIAGTYTIPTYFKGRQLNVAFAADAKKRLHVPVCVVGNITTLAEAEEIISSGKADLVAMAKSFMADGSLVQKSIAGQANLVRPCTRCDLCGNANTYGTTMHCAINPRMGLYRDLQPLPTEQRRKVIVIGGGPGGMMAAQTLSKLGHAVTLYEKTDRLGGLLNDAVLLSFKGYMRHYLHWDINETMNCGATIVFNTEVTAALVQKENPDAVIVATGSNYGAPPIPGIERTLSVRDVDAHSVPVGNSVIVCGGGLSGLECALALSMEGKKVTVLDMIPAASFCGEMPIFNRADLFDQLERGGVTLIGEQRIKSISESGVETADATGKTHVYSCDHVVNALGVVPNDALAKELLHRYPDGIFPVGDCVGRGRNYGDANREGYDAALRV